MANPAPSPPAQPIRIAVAGDVFVDHHIYLYESGEARRLREIRELGGAAATNELLQQLIRQTHVGEKTPPAFETHLATSAPELESTLGAHHSYGLWKPYPVAPGSKKLVWRSTNLLKGHVHEERDTRQHYVPRRKKNGKSPNVLVLEDHAQHFRQTQHRDCWMLSDGTYPDWIILKTSGRLDQDALWHQLVTEYPKNIPDRLICIVSANDLRGEPSRITHGLSWERTIDQIDGLANPILAGFNACRHLVITFSADGALWLERTEPRRATLIFDAGGTEGGWAGKFEGDAFGYLTCASASIVYSVARSLAEKKPVDLAAAIEGGLRGMRDLRQHGHGNVYDELPHGYPVRRLAEAIIKPSSVFSRVTMPWPPKSTTGLWTIIESSQRPFESAQPVSLLGIGRKYVLNGLNALKRFPHAQFGKLVTAERSEIESLRRIRRQMIDYQQRGPADKPLSIGVFGPPGAGKSFGVRELCKEIFGEAAWKEFNLSQFGEPSDLIGAFHQVRDVVLSGTTPVVFWDEFDTREFEWLQYLLAPMQDGRFRHGQISHAIGKCVFVFAGGTSHSYVDFGREPVPDKEGKITSEEQASWRRFCLRKGPDFKSRLDGFYNVAGPNQRDLSDVGYTLRRAILIRAHMGYEPIASADFDYNLFDALMLVSSYRHGARSLEKLVASLRQPETRIVIRSLLPPSAEINMHVDEKEFRHRLEKEAGEFRISNAIEDIASGIHETWRNLSRQQGGWMQPRFDQPYDQLEEADKEDNRAAARRIPDILGLAGMGVALPDEDAKAISPQAVDSHLDDHMERLAEAEHDGWMAQRLHAGWRYGKTRDDAAKIHPLLKPYADLPEKEKEKDRNSVRHFPEMVKRARYKIVWLGTTTGRRSPRKTAKSKVRKRSKKG